MLVLASQSPRRGEILRQAGIPFVVRAAPVDETPQSAEAPVDYVRRVAALKAQVVPVNAGEIVLGADTTVVVGDSMLGKPADAADACRMLRLLSGRRHDVITGICLRRGGADPPAAGQATAEPDRKLRSSPSRESAVGEGCAGLVSDHALTAVWFAAMTEREIEDYAASGEPMDKAGAYAIQGLASKFIQRIEGCYFNVVGLPVALVYRLLRATDPGTPG
jgi:septum formation protein